MITRWEKFTAGPPAPKATRYYVSINPSGIILLNQRIYEDFGKSDAVVLLFDRATSRLGLCPAHRKLKEAFPVKSKDGYWFVQAGVFCTHFNIRVERTERFADPEIDKDGVLVLDLTRTVSAAQRQRRPKKRNN